MYISSIFQVEITGLLCNNNSSLLIFSVYFLVSFYFTFCFFNKQVINKEFGINMYTLLLLLLLLLSCFSHVWLCVTLWTVAHQPPLCTGFSRQEYWGGLPFLLQGIFLTLRSNPCLSYLLHWEVSSLPLAPPEKPIYMNVCMCNLTDIKHQHRWTYISAYSSKNPECTLWSNL